MALKRVLIANKSFPEAGRNILRDSGVTFEVVPFLDYEPESLAAIKEKIKGVNALIWNTKHKLSAEVLDIAGPQLSCVSTMSSGMDHIDLEAVKRRGIVLGNTPKVLDNSVADIAVGLMIAAARRFKEGVQSVEDGTWRYGVNWTLGRDVAGGAVGVVGLGGVGRAVLRRLAGFDVGKCMYSGRSDKPEAKELGAERVPLDTLFRESDFIVLACPLTAETRHLVNEESLRKMKSTAVIVNIARGEVIDQEALYSALKERRIFAAGLDVTTPEPMDKAHPLVSLPNCYILPHYGSSTVGTRDAMASIAAKNIQLALQGLTMESPWKL